MSSSKSYESLCSSTLSMDIFDQDLNNTTIRNYDCISEIGRGTFSIVWLVYDKIGKKPYAMKIHDSDEFLNTMDEIKFIKTLPLNSGFNNLIDYFIETSVADLIDKPLLCSIWELHACDLDYYIRQVIKGGLEVRLSMKIIKQVLKALEILHIDLNTYHGDIKPDNILIKGISLKNKNHINNYLHNTTSFETNISDEIIIDGELTVCLSDFGSFCKSDEEHDSSFGTVYYQAPEIILKGKCSYPVDIWAIGCTLYEMITGTILFDTDNPSAHLSRIQDRCGKFDIQNVMDYKLYKKYFNNNKLINYTGNTCELLEGQLFKKMLSINPETRINVKDLINMF